MSMKSTPCSTAARTTRDRAGAVGRLAPDAGAGQLHRAVAEAVDGQVPADAEGVAQLRSRHVRGQHAEPARVFPAACSMAPDGRDRRGAARADRVEPQRAAHRRDRPAAAPRGRGRRPGGWARRSRGGPSPRCGSARGSGPGGPPSSPGWTRRRRSTTTWSRSTTAATRAGRRRRSAPSSAARGRCGATARCPARHPGETLAPGRRSGWTACWPGPAARLADGDVALVAHGHVLRVLTARWLGLAPGGRRPVRAARRQLRRARARARPAGAQRAGHRCH